MNHVIQISMASLTINGRIYEDVKAEARKQHRSTASLVESLIINAGYSTEDQIKEREILA